MRYRGDMTPTARPLSGTETAAAKQLLRSAAFAHLAMVEPDGPYVVPLNFAYAENEGGPAGELHGRVYFHTGEGRKTDALAADPRVCLSVTDCVVFHQGDSPCADGFSFQSLLVWGDARLIEEGDRRETALRAIVGKYHPEAAGAPFDEAVLARTLIYEVAIESAGFRERPRRR
jgi:nitroimidazol reductase NimA-like FMN-containing flavoprotein (pyridoxamine 5'-phosphate oxidase superfamily)